MRTSMLRSGLCIGCVAAALAAGCSREPGPAKHATAPTGAFESRVSSEPGGASAGAQGRLFEHPTSMDESDVCKQIDDHVNVAQVMDVPWGIALILEPEDDEENTASARAQARYIEEALLPTGGLILLKGAGEGCGLERLIGKVSEVKVTERQGRVEVQLTSSDTGKMQELRKAARAFADEID